MPIHFSDGRGYQPTDRILMGESDLEFVLRYDLRVFFFTVRVLVAKLNVLRVNGFVRNSQPAQEMLELLAPAGDILKNVGFRCSLGLDLYGDLGVIWGSPRSRVALDPRSLNPSLPPYRA